MTKRLYHAEPRRFWLDAEKRALRKMYPDMRTDDIARILGRDVSACYRMAAMLGLEKSAAYNASPLSGRNVKGFAPNGANSRFQKGHVPANKGLRRPGWHRGRMRETQFKKGHVSKRWDTDAFCVGALRINADGYIDMKIADGPRGWQALHRILWEDANGPVPANHVIVFKDKDKMNVVLENLECISRGELARRNVYWNNYPRELAETIQLLGAINRRLNHDDREIGNRNAA